MTFFYDDFVNGFYDPTANAQGRVDVLSDTIKALAIDPLVYVASPSEVTLADIIAIGGILSTSAALTTVAVVARGFTSDPFVFPAVAAGPDIGAIVLYKEGADDAHSPLMLYLDAASAGLPFTPSGIDITVNPGAGGYAVL